MNYPIPRQKIIFEQIKINKLVNLNKINRDKLENKIKNKICKDLKLDKNKALVSINSSARNSFFMILSILRKRFIDYKYNKPKVLIAGFNFSLMREIIIKAGFSPEFIDIDKNKLTISKKELFESIDEDCKVAIITHTLGNVVDLETIEELKRKGIIVIEDCAHTYLSDFEEEKQIYDFSNSNFIKIGKNKKVTQKNEIKKVGTQGDIAIFSTNYSKPIAGLYGGFIILNNDKLIDIKKQIIKFENEGKIIELKQELKCYIKSIGTYSLINKHFFFKLITFSMIKKSFDKNKKSDYLDIYSADELFFKPSKLKKMNKLSLLILEQNLNTSSNRNKIISKIQSKYDISILNNLLNNKKLDEEDIIKKNEKQPKYLYPVFVKDKNKAKKYFLEYGIDIKKIYCYDISLGKCKNSEIMQNHLIYIPLYSSLTNKEIKQIIKIVNNYTEKNN
jgi:dTDP-4-amino-4,6-dideoxygalactose transaminase